MFFPAASLFFLINGNMGVVIGFQLPSTSSASYQLRLAHQRAMNTQLGSSNYENEDFMEGRNRGGFYSSNNSFRVAGVGAQDHQVIVPREEPRPPTPRGRHMYVTTSYPEGLDSFGRYRPSDPRMDGEAPLRVGGRPVEGHQVIRPRRAPRSRTERGPHMDVTTSNPRFIPTVGRRSGPYYEDEEYGMGGFDARERVYRGGVGVRPDTKDLQGVGRMPMQSEEWDRYRNVREESTPFRSNRSIRDNDRGEVPHFMARDDDEGLPVSFGDDMDRRLPSSRQRMDSFDGDFRGVNRESIREREWRDLEASAGRRRRGYFRPDTQDLQGLGRMPMRGEDWDDMAYPERRNVGFQGARRRFSENDLLDDFGASGPENLRHYSVDRRRDDYTPRRSEMPDEGFDDDYVREGPHMIRNELFSYRDEERRRRRRSDDLVDADDDRYYRTGSRDLYTRTRPPRRDQRGSIGGPMSEDLFGVDSEYAASRQSWTTGTSMDTIQ